MESNFDDFTFDIKHLDSKKTWELKIYLAPTIVTMIQKTSSRQMPKVNIKIFHPCSYVKFVFSIIYCSKIKDIFPAMPRVLGRHFQISYICAFLSKSMFVFLLEIMFYKCLSKALKNALNIWQFLNENCIELWTALPKSQ